MLRISPIMPGGMIAASIFVLTEWISQIFPSVRAQNFKNRYKNSGDDTIANAVSKA